MSSAMKSTVIGPFETVFFPDFKLGQVTAKIDTGAYTGALHCTRVRTENTEQGQVLRFSPFDHPDREFEAANFAVRHVRSSNGTPQQRYFINTRIKIQGQIYPIVLSLADRSEMRWPVLIGRRFLRKHNFVVDLSRRPKYRGRVQG
jgi:hypothetical protein